MLLSGRWTWYVAPVFAHDLANGQTVALFVRYMVPLSVAKDRMQQLGCGTYAEIHRAYVSGPRSWVDGEW